MPSAMMRPMVSVEPPVASGTTSVTWREGKSCALAVADCQQRRQTHSRPRLFSFHFLPVVLYTLAPRVRRGLGGPRRPGLFIHADPPGFGLTAPASDPPPVGGATRRRTPRAAALDRDAHLLGRGRRLARPARHVVRRAVDHRGRAEGNRQRHFRRRAPGAVARGVARLLRLRRRRNPDGPARQQLRHPLDRDRGLADDRARACDLLARRALAALCRPRPVHGLHRQCRIERTAVRLCQPLVRPPPRLGAGADFQRRLSRGLRLADRSSSARSRSSAGAGP